MNVSVVIPAWNAEETIADTLNSLLAQKHQLWEAVVVDDGSVDGTERLVREYAESDARIRLVQRDHGGEAAARNLGLVSATHPWLLFLDSDDWIAPEYLTRMTAELKADPTLDAVHCLYARVAADGTRVVDSYEPPAGDMFSTWARRSAFPVHACVVRRDLVHEVGGFDPSLRKSADWDLWQRVARTGARFGALRETLAFYRMRPSAASLEAPQMLRDGLTVLRRGHAPDPRVPRPHPDHALGSPPEEVRTQAWYLLCWCSGLLIGRGHDARPLIDLCDVEPFPELYPPAVAEALWNAAPLPLCQGTGVWVQLWLQVHADVDDFLVALEAASGAPELAQRTRSVLLRSVLRASPALSPVADELANGETRHAEAVGGLEWRDERIREAKAMLKASDDRKLELEKSLTARDARIREMETSLSTREERIREVEASLVTRDDRIREIEGSLATRDDRIRELEGSLATRDDRIQELEASLVTRDDRIREVEASLARRDDRVREMEEHVARMEAETRSLIESRDRLSAELQELWNSLERRAGAFLLNRLRLRRPVAWLSRRSSRDAGN